MGADVVGYLVAILVGGLVLVLCWLVLVGRRTPEQVREAGNKWAWQHQAYVDAKWTEQVDAQLRANRRLDFVGIFVLCGVLTQMPTSMRAHAACLALVPALIATLRGLSLVHRDGLPPGAHVARLRELTLADYLPQRSRLVMWVAALIGAAATVAVARQHHQPWVMLSAAMLILGPAAVEVAGSRLARQPEPQNVVWWGLGIGIGLLTVKDSAEGRTRPAAYMRSRLWPTLGADQVLRSGDPLPTRGAS